MSSRKLDFTANAQRDIRSILRYTRSTWGVRQRDIYSRQLRTALEQLAHFPDLGEYQALLPLWFGRVRSGSTLFTIGRGLR